MILGDKPLISEVVLSHPILERRDYEGVPWAEEDEDMTSVTVGVVGWRSTVGCRRRGEPIPSFQRLFDRS
jgi:hypothetical protein